MKIQQLSDDRELREDRVLSSSSEPLPWKVALPVIAGLSALGWVVTIAFFLEIRRLIGF
jgi:hypothetical protein